MGKTGLKEKIKDILYGLFFFDIYLSSKKFAQQYNDFIYLVILGEILGVPIMATYYTLRLVPYIYGDLIQWKVRYLREKDITDNIPDIGV